LTSKSEFRSAALTVKRGVIPVLFPDHQQDLTTRECYERWGLAGIGDKNVYLSRLILDDLGSGLTIGYVSCPQLNGEDDFGGLGDEFGEILIWREAYIANASKNNAVGSSG
jgi:hypothetical protein